MRGKPKRPSELCTDVISAQAESAVKSSFDDAAWKDLPVSDGLYIKQPFRPSENKPAEIVNNFTRPARP
ncbi:hypothetical protein BG910_09520 [Neisseria chenwenguii]|uniref:Uncharacterized protein n=1 Tax=Neisseria chenwenguii TaxID=1853278 RepID=A0A220S3F4_9NEIS|nr:hypothetical protein BG910_09520 [Neisseria chenwenguii]ROV56206.1 hypothetical protein EGS38_05625 [Neisseria chenwenguii]